MTYRDKIAVLNLQSYYRLSLKLQVRTQVLDQALLLIHLGH